MNNITTIIVSYSSVLLELRTGILCSGDVEAQYRVSLGVSHGRYFFQSVSGAKKEEGGVHYFFDRLHHHGNYGNPWPPPPLARPVTGDANGEVGQGLGQLWFANPDGSMLALGH